jgi:hypothetical protein
MSKIIPVITLYQPWATFVIIGLKTIETRLHPKLKSLAGKTIGIHAGMKYDDSDEWVPYVTEEEQMLCGKAQYIHGAILGTALVTSFGQLDKTHSKRALIDCENTLRYGLLLSQIEKWEAPVSAKGDMGIWYYDTELKQKVKKPKRQSQLFTNP